jgi:hypothetical protein
MITSYFINESIIVCDSRLGVGALTINAEKMIMRCLTGAMAHFTGADR